MQDQQSELFFRPQPQLSGFAPSSTGAASLAGTGSIAAPLVATGPAPRASLLKPRAPGWLDPWRVELQLLGLLAASMTLAWFIRPVRPAIAIAMALVFLITAFARLELAICLYMFQLIAPPLLPTANLFGVPGLNADTGMILVLIAAAMNRARERRRDPERKGRPLARSNPVALPLAVFMGLVLVSVLRSPILHSGDMVDTIGLAKQLLTGGLLAWVVSAGLEDEQEAVKVLGGFFLVLTFLSAFAIRDTLQHLSDARFRLDTFLGQSNEFGGFMAMFAPVVLTALLAKACPRAFRLPLLGLLGACLVSLLFTLSRGSMLGFAAAMFALGALHSRKFLLVVVLAAALWSSWIPQRVISRVQETQVEKSEYGVDNSTAVRVRQWRALPVMMGDAPLVGHGFMTFRQLYADRVTGIQKSAHSSWLRILVEQGLTGFAAALWLLGAITLLAWKVKRRGDSFLAQTLGPGLLAVMAATVVVNMAGSRFHNPIISAYLWILAGLLVVAWRALPERAEATEPASQTCSPRAPRRDPLAGFRPVPQV